MTVVYLIAAVDAEARAIGNRGDLPWPHLPEDMNHFKHLTTGQLADPKKSILIMGRGTYDSIGNKLPDRISIVVSKKLVLEEEDIFSVDSPEKALAFACTAGAPEVWIIGGQSMYQYFLSKADALFLTLVTGPVPGANRYFPEYEKDFEKVDESESYQEGDFEYCFTIWERKKKEE